ncbi:hypothetical protein UCD39_01905 [Nitrospirillum sp. BR 11752]|uniref:hypothetical protein n=1 Tax=Nitrospirillum sp. BR 11752 TaxID=3104293 RepID=UPI002EB1462E|nr:hypothetical protein [Nitrospirillum sp. BR 11752]
MWLKYEQWIVGLANLLILGAVMVAAGRPFTYPLDDTYIQMAIARTWGDSGVWGIDRLDPAAASSSPLFVLVLAAVHLLWGARTGFELVPLAINAAVMIGCVLAWDAILDAASAAEGARSRPTPRFRSLMRVGMLMALSAATPLFVTAIIGMEHTPQVLAYSLFTYHGSRAVADRQACPDRTIIRLAIAACAVAALRYEAVLIIGPLCLVAVINGRLRLAAALALGAAVPMAAFGLAWVADGGWPVPNSILMKLMLHDQDGQHVIQFFPAAWTLFGIMTITAGLVALRAHRRWWGLGLGSLRHDWGLVLGGIALCCAAAQVVLGMAGWLYRYEAAAIALNMLAAFVILLQDHRLRVQALVLLALVAVASYRTADAVTLATAAPHDRRWEHVEPAAFVARFYGTSPVIVNDIGVMAWLAPQARVLDLAGLANNDIARQRLSPSGLSWQAVDDWTRRTGAPLAVIQICWDPIAHVLPDGWRIVALWVGPRNVLFGDRVVGIFATSQAEAAPLAANLRRYETTGGRLVYFDDLPQSYHMAFMRKLRQTGCSAVKDLATAAQRWRVQAPGPGAR